MPDGRIDSRLRHRRHSAATLKEASRPSARLVVLVPVEARNETEALRKFQPDRVHVCQQHDGSDDSLRAARHLAQPELGSLLDAIGEIEAGIGKHDHLGIRRLGLQQEAAEVRRIEGMTHGADDLSACLFDGHAGDRFHGFAKSVIDGDEEPGIEPLAHQRLGNAGAVRIGVVDPVKADGRASRTGEIRGRRGRMDDDPVALAHDLLCGKRDSGVAEIEHRLDVIDVEPFAQDAGADVRLVLVIRRQHLDGDAVGASAVILDREFCRLHRAKAGQVGERSGLVVQDADSKRCFLLRAQAHRHCCRRRHDACKRCAACDIRFR